jgi:hypothetical protein
MYQSSPESDSKCGRKVYVVGNGEELPDKTIEEIQWETDVELTRAACLAREAKEERGTMAYRTTQVHQKMSLEMVLP